MSREPGAGRASSHPTQPEPPGPSGRTAAHKIRLHQAELQIRLHSTVKRQQSSLTPRQRMAPCSAKCRACSSGGKGFLPSEHRQFQQVVLALSTLCSSYHQSLGTWVICQGSAVFRMQLNVPSLSPSVRQGWLDGVVSLFFSFFLFLLQTCVNAVCVTQRPSSTRLLCPFIAVMAKTHRFERFWELERAFWGRPVPVQGGHPGCSCRIAAFSTVEGEKKSNLL